MGRIRTIKPEFPVSRTIGNLSRDARLLFISLWTIVDDSGRFHAHPRVLTGALYPYDVDALELLPGWLAELEREGCIEQYQVGGTPYLVITNWSKHQKIDRPSKSRFPHPDDDSRDTREPSRDSREPSSTDLGPKDLGPKDLGPRTGTALASSEARGPGPKDLRTKGPTRSENSSAAYGAAPPLATPPEGGAATSSSAPASLTATATAKATPTATTACEAKSEKQIIADAFKLFCEVFHRDPKRTLGPLELLKAQARLGERENATGSLDAAGKDFMIAIGHLAASEPRRQPDWSEDLVKSRKVFEAHLNGANPEVMEIAIASLAGEFAMEKGRGGG